MHVREYWALTKPRVIFLMLITCWVGMGLVYPKPPDALWRGLIASIGIACSAAAAAALNHCVEHHIDAKMSRTAQRPLVKKTISIQGAFRFSLLLGLLGLFLLAHEINVLTAGLTAASLLGYAAIYTLYLKHATPQNIVIGGIAGATPPLLGWTSFTNQIDALPLILVLIIFIWTPPHFWALAIARKEDYASANLPMLPVTHGTAFTCLSIVLYLILLSVVSLFPVFIHQAQSIYLVSTLILNGIFLVMGIQLWRIPTTRRAYQLFTYSIVYLTLLFTMLLVDHYWSL